MLPAKVLMKLAYKAFQSGAKDDASALTALALASDDAESLFVGADALDSNFVDKSHQAVSPVPGIAKPSQDNTSEKDEEASITNLLENGEVDESIVAPAPADQTGYTVKGLYDRVQGIAASLEKLGFSHLALEVRSCLE